MEVPVQLCKVQSDGDRQRTEGDWQIGGEPMAEVNSFVYLGVEFGKRRGWKEMKSKVMAKVEGRIKKVDVFEEYARIGDQGGNAGVGCDWQTGDGIWS